MVLDSKEGMEKGMNKGLIKWLLSFLQFLLAMTPVWLAVEALEKHDYPHAVAYICLFVWILVFQYLDKDPVHIEIIHKGDTH
jgi:hypothetical protein